MNSQFVSDIDGKNSSLDKLQDLLTSEELSELVQAIETVKNFRNGFGIVKISFEQRRIKQVAMTSTIKPGI